MLSSSTQSCMNFKKIKTKTAVFIAKAFVKLPLSWVLKIGEFLGFLMWLLPNKRKKIAARNIQLCFSELSAEQQKQLLKQNIISTGIGFAEMLYALWGSDEKILARCQFNGLEHISEALKQQKGCILLSCHLHPMELTVKAINLSLQQPGFMLARQHNNKIFESYVDTARRKHCQKTIDKKDLRTVLKSLKANRAIYYYPDQNFSYNCLYIDFFKQAAATVVAIDKIAKSTKTQVVPFFGFRTKDKHGKTMWKIDFLPALDFFQTDDTKTSLTKMNQLFEQQIKKHPEQYLWVHRRFKNHPKGRNYLYQDL